MGVGAVPNFYNNKTHPSLVRYDSPNFAKPSKTTLILILADVKTTPGFTVKLLRSAALCASQQVFFTVGKHFFRAADWKLDNPDWTGRLKLVAMGKKLEARLEDKNTGVKSSPRRQWLSSFAWDLLFFRFFSI